MRKLEDIQNSMINLVQGDPVLGSQLTSTSNTALWRLWIYIFAFALYLHEQIVERNAENSRPHTRQWYREQALAFVDGAPLIWKDGQFSFDMSFAPGELEDVRPVKRVALAEAPNGVLVIKTAGIGSAGTEPLDGAVHERFKSYMNQIKDAGNRLDFINLPADELELELKVWVDDLIINLSTGELVNESGVVPVEDACMDYLSQLEFNGAFFKTFLTDRLQKADGIKVPMIVRLRHRVSGGVWKTVEEYIEPHSGHFIYDSISVEYIGLSPALP